MRDAGVNHEHIDLQYDPAEGLKAALERICDQAERAVRSGKLVICSCRTATSSRPHPGARAARHRRGAPPARRTGLRCKCNLLVETGTARDAHHFACLIGYGATAVYPYMAYQTLFDMMKKGA
jgi:glutamate synthase (NADPH) large chain